MQAIVLEKKVIIRSSVLYSILNHAYMPRCLAIRPVISEIIIYREAGSIRILSEKKGNILCMDVLV